ncbi:MAG: hypothetical protein HY577_02240 [Candidatus Nealsonbacteria bacterium]|nr:hypothetical protein [Candidatus Nealsonbacteria bacterium]
MADYTKEQLWKLYEKLPSDLKEAIFSADNADHIADICRRNSLPTELNSSLAKIAGDVLMGLLLPGDFQGTIEKELKLEKSLAKKVGQEVNRLIFFPVKDSLNLLNKIEAGAEETTTTKAAPARAVEEPVPAPKKERISKADTYREPIE